MNKGSEDNIFMNAEEIMYKEKNNKRLSFSKNLNAKSKGAIILS
jgi:hypothetical protein